jgi:plastocyanin
MRRLSRLILFFVCTLTVHAAEANLTLRLTSGDLPLADAVASLTPLDFAPPAPHMPDAVIAQENKEYDPYVTVLQAGTEAAFPNRDNVQHHLYSVSKAKRFEKPLYASGDSETVVFDVSGVVTLGCNIHDWMVAYVLVVPTPWFVKTGPDGVAALPGVPPGRYRLEIWHPRLSKVISREISLTAGMNPGETVELKLKPDRRIRRAPTGRSGGY